MSVKKNNGRTHGAQYFGLGYIPLSCRGNVITRIEITKQHRQNFYFSVDRYRQEEIKESFVISDSV